MSEPAIEPTPEPPTDTDETPEQPPVTLLCIGGPKAGEWVTLRPGDWDYTEMKPTAEFKLLSMPRHIVVPTAPNGHGGAKPMPGKVLEQSGTGQLLRYEYMMFGATRLRDNMQVARWTLRFPEPPPRGEPGVQLSEALVKLFFDGEVVPPA